MGKDAIKNFVIGAIVSAVLTALVLSLIHIWMKLFIAVLVIGFLK